MAQSLRTAFPISSDAIAMNIATPALGPSFGTAPAGTWMWMSSLSNPEQSICSASQRDLTSVSAAWALSFITSPNWPVSTSLPPPGELLASMKSRSPPTGVHASPVATPGKLVRIATSLSKRRCPSIEAS